MGVQVFLGNNQQDGKQDMCATRVALWTSFGFGPISLKSPITKGNPLFNGPLHTVTVWFFYSRNILGMHYFTILNIETSRGKHNSFVQMSLKFCKRCPTTFLYVCFVYILSLVESNYITYSFINKCVHHYILFFLFFIFIFIIIVYIFLSL